MILETVKDVLLLVLNVHLPAIHKMFQYHCASVILCRVGETIIFEHGCYISALEDIVFCASSMHKHNL